MQRRVRILPGSQYTGLPTPPHEDPPRPEDLVSLLVVGNAQAGKTSLVEAFLHHTSDEQIVRDGSTAASVQSHPSTATSHRSRRRVLENNNSWSVKYHKKDILFAAAKKSQNNNNNVDQSTTPSSSSSSLRSLRVQLWDTSGLRTTGNTSNTNNHERDADWKVLWNKASVVCIVVSLGDPLEEVLQTIQAWHTWCEHQQQSQSEQTSADKREYVLFLHQADLLLEPKAATPPKPPQHPTEWMQRGGKISDLCRSLPLLTSWYFTSSRLEDEYLGNSIDTAFRQLLGTKGKPYVLKPSSNRSANWSDSTTTPTAITAESVTTSDHTTTRLDPTTSTNGTQPTTSRTMGEGGGDHENRRGRSTHTSHNGARIRRASAVPISPLS